MADHKERIVRLIAEQLGVEVEKLHDDTHFVKDLGADSLDMVEIVMELEEEFDIQIPDDKAESVETLGQAVALVEEKIKAQG